MTIISCELTVAMVTVVLSSLADCERRRWLDDITSSVNRSFQSEPSISQSDYINWQMVSCLWTSLSHQLYRFWIASKTFSHCWKLVSKFLSTTFFNERETQQSSESTNILSSPQTRISLSGCMPFQSYQIICHPKNTKRGLFLFYFLTF